MRKDNCQLLIGKDSLMYMGKDNLQLYMGKGNLQLCMGHDS